MKHTNYIQVFLAFLLLVSCSSSGGGGKNSGDAPVAQFSLSSEGGNAPVYIMANASESSDPNGTIVSYAWEFGDGTDSEGITASHIYTTSGNYKLSLTVTDDESKTSTSSKTISVTTTNETFTLTGAISIMAGTEVDGDVNDPRAIYTANNDMDHAQEISNPTVVGGYVTFKNNGEEGPLHEDGDESDFYEVTLAANESITLYIANADDGDLDLYLYDKDGDLTDSSKDDKSNMEYIQVTENGTYFIEVKAFSGASNYVLNIGQNQTPSQSSQLSLKGDFVPGEIIVTFADNFIPAGNIDRVAFYENATGLKRKSGAPGRAMLFTLGDSEDSKNALKKLSANRLSSSIKKGIENLPPETKRKFDTLLAVKALRKRADVITADPNYIRKPFSTKPNDSSYNYQWHYPLLHLPQAWDVTTGSADVIVAVIDTGVLINHPDISGKTVQGYDFIRDPSNSLDGDGIDSNPDDPGDKAYGNTSSFHGTHVSGTIAAASDNHKGVCGIGWSVKIMPLRVLGNIGGTDYDIIQAIHYAAGLSNDSGTTPSKIADVINLSFGGPDSSRTAKNAYLQAREKGIILVAAAGNESSSSRSYPAAHEGVISVSAVDMAKKLAPYSNYGASYDKWIDVAAPGGDSSADLNGDGYADGVLSTGANDASGTIKYGYYFMEGTSMATPHVVGIIALMKSVKPDLSPDDIQTLLENGDITEDIGSDIYYGNGLIDAYLAVTKAQELEGSGTTTSSATLVVSPSSLNFDTSKTSITISTTNGGSGNLSISGVSADESWITITESSVDSNKLGSYKISVDRTGLSIGAHNGNITFSSTSNSVFMPVLMQVAGSTDTLNAGLNYLVIVPFGSSPDETFTAFPLYAENGVYGFTITDVQAGLYNIYAGTDQNNDGYICDWGESCGIYITMSAPKLISVNNDVNGLNFSTGFRSVISDQTSLGTDTYSSKAGIARVHPIKIRKEPTQKNIYSYTDSN
ncbi:MAG: S8 family serine peptidase [Proteobacteria bacterium]|nr:S8 family serine peptidase [Pseudomonadota bacterium]